MPKIKILILFFIALLLAPSIALGEVRLPEILSSGTTVIDSHNGNTYTYYGGMTGNYAVLNHDPDSTYGFTRRADEYDFGLLNCYDAIPSLSTVCFNLGTGLTGEGNAPAGRLMTSSTSVIDYDGNRQPLYQLPALYLGDVNIIGDAYSTDYSNFAFWGRNLAENPSGTVSSDTGASWRLGNYTNNPQAQSEWSSDQTIAFREQKLPILESEATVFTEKNYSSALTILALDYANITSNILSTRQNEKYPEGKIWKLDTNDPDDLSFESTSKTYYGKGTIIVPGNLTIKSGVDILPNGAGDRLGFIVLGDVTFEGNNDVKAAILCLGAMTVGNNVQLTGSFVAQSFSTGANNSFIYDYAFDKDWPPGFRNLNMPQAAPGQ